MNSLNERDRVRPKGKHFAFGKIIDVLPKNRVRVCWDFPRGNRFEILPTADVLLIPEDEALVVARFLRELDERLREPVFLMAADVAIELWLDARRDGLDLQIDDLIETVAVANHLARLQSRKPVIFH